MLDESVYKLRECIYSLRHVRIVVELDVLAVLPATHVLLAAGRRVMRQVRVAVIAVVARHAAMRMLLSACLITPGLVSCPLLGLLHERGRGVVLVVRRRVVKIECNREIRS